jgi:Zn-dependent alcohol dehydrogenase
VSCAGVTGWGSVQNTARLQGRETAVVVGIGGAGANALIAARFLGAADVVAVDPLASKREWAASFGANLAVSDFAEAREQVGALTRGRMADVVIMSMGVGDGSLCMSGSWHGRRGASFLLGLAERGLYDPGRIVDATYDLDHPAQGYEDQLAGRTLRGVVRMHGGPPTADKRSRVRSSPAGASPGVDSGPWIRSKVGQDGG